MKRKGFKSFVLKVCETKGFADAFLGKCVYIKGLPKKNKKKRKGRERLTQRTQRTRREPVELIGTQKRETHVSPWFVSKGLTGIGLSF